MTEEQEKRLAEAIDLLAKYLSITVAMASSQNARKAGMIIPGGVTSLEDMYSAAAGLLAEKLIEMGIEYDQGVAQ